MNFLFKFAVSKFKDYVVRNWKTTLVGILGSVLSQYVKDPQLQKEILAGTVALIAVLSKDGDKSGTTEQPRGSLPLSP